MWWEQATHSSRVEALLITFGFQSIDLNTPGPVFQSLSVFTAPDSGTNGLLLRLYPPISQPGVEKVVFAPPPPPFSSPFHIIRNLPVKLDPRHSKVTCL